MTVSPPQDSESRRTGLVCVLLGLVTVLVYGRVGGFDFTNYDEPNYIYENPIVRAGLTLPGIYWGITTSYFDFWHPLTWWSHMLDVDLFGLRPGWHHLMNLAFHVANTVLLYLVLRRMTGAIGRSAMVAALFALHPMHVESVAWLAERKDVLSGFFFMLTLWTYGRYVTENEGGDKSEGQDPQAESHPKSEIRKWTVWYWLAVALFALGLMTKPMVVTLPFVLLLLDYWPLRRTVGCGMQSAEFRRLLYEKVPFFALAFGSSVITYAGMRVAQQNPYSASTTPWGLRFSNAAVSCVRYLGKLIWPTDLAVVYPLPGHWPAWQVAGAVLVLVLISVAVVVLRRSAAYLVFGWLLFLGMLVPVIGLVAMSYAALADRYTYLPSFGIFVAVVWAVAELGQRVTKVLGRHRNEVARGEPVETVGEREARSTRLKLGVNGTRPGRGLVAALDASSGMVALGGVALVVYGIVAWIQVGHWRNSYTLWSHCVQVTHQNPAAHYNLAHVLADMNRRTEAMEQYRQAIESKPDYLEAHLNLGSLLAESGQKREATNCFAIALRLNPQHALAQRNMGVTLLDLGDVQGAKTHCTEAIRLNASDFVAYAGLARALSAEGKSDEAVRRYGESLSLNPQFVEAHYYLGLEFLKRGQYDAAATSLGTAARLEPERADIREQLEIALKQKARTNS